MTENTGRWEEGRKEERKKGRKEGRKEGEGINMKEKEEGGKGREGKGREGKVEEESDKESMGARKKRQYIERGRDRRKK